MNHNEFNKEFIGKSYIEPGMKTIECVGFSKLYCIELWLPISSFGWSAINGWITGCPFNSKWKRVEYKTGMYPPQWSVLFWSENRCKYWHTWISNKFCNKDVLRYTDSNWTGKRDNITARFTGYENLLGWYTYISK